MDALPSPRLLGLFQKRIDGDDALLELARVRFKEAGLGMEFYAETAMELDSLLKFKPSPETPAVVHLGRGINLFVDESQDLILDFATRFSELVFGFVIHDQIEIITRFDDYLIELKKLVHKLEKIQNRPYIFIEYAVGLTPDLFTQLMKAIQDLQGISGCIDVGHVGLWQVRAAYAESHPGRDVCALMPHDPELPGLIEDVQRAVRSAIEQVLYVIQNLGGTQKPVHFHLHDGHPLSTLSPLGISDHLSFMETIPIPFDYEGKGYLDPMFGPSGLSAIITESLEHLDPDRISFSLEIHPTEGRLGLEGEPNLFNHWEDKANAERMNYWLSVLAKNKELVSQVARSWLEKLQRN